MPHSFPIPPPEPTESHIKNLLRLLSDPNPKISSTIHFHLVSIGPSALPYLTQAYHEQPELQIQLNHVIHEIQFADVEHTFQRLAYHEMDLEQGAFQLARIAYPSLNPQPYIEQLDRFASEIETLRPVRRSNAHTLLLLLIRYLFEDHRFRGNTENYYDPDNSFLHCVLDRRMGIPITLSVLCMLVAKRLNLSLVGIGLPGHFIVQWPPGEIFIDCFNQGTLLTQEECEQFLRKSGYDIKPEYFHPTPHHRILLRMINNLISIYAQQEEHPHVTKLRRLAHILTEVEGQRIDKR